MLEEAERQGVDVRAVRFIAAGIFAFLLISLGILALSFPGFISRTVQDSSSFPEPSVRTDERAERLQLERVQRERLSAHNGGIPIEEAMKMIAAKGARAFDPVTGAAR